ncbi:hypothetical protein AB0958_04300 [Streptomyces sp. NPDC006655]|uniref:hypothetical protein n=1 Tax=Streptomyces sp. NPDC006655 TaxID=3156898 RepID=UPI003455CCF8
MITGRGRREDERPAHDSGIHIGGNNNAPNQNVVGQNISHVYQSASVQGAVDIETVRGLLASFRAEVDRNEGNLDHAVALRAMADTVDASLATPNPQARAGALRGVAQALPALVAGTMVEQGGEALVHAIAGWLS